MKNTQIYRNLVINGSLTTEELTVGPFTFPSTDGSSGEVLTTDGLGNVTWQSIGSLSLTTDDVAEGGNQYFTNERVDDRVSNLIQDGTGISWTYNDGANTLTGNVSLSAFSTTDLSEGINQYFTNEKVDDRVSSLIQDGTGISWNYNDSLGTLTPTISLASFSTTDLSEGTNQYFTNEKVDDRVSNLIQDGTGITWLYNDIANTLTPTVSLSSFTTDDLAEGAINKYLTNENIDDRVAALVQDTSTVTWTYNDGANTLSADAVSIVEVQDNGSTVASYDTINFIEGSGITLNFTNDALNNRVDVEIVSTGGGGSGTVNAVASSGVLVGDPDITTLNFLDNFLITESPNQQINIDLSVLLSDISDVSLVSPLVDGDFLRYNGTLGIWENSSFDEATGEFLRTVSTGLYSGGSLSINGGDNTKFDISDGSGVVIDNWTDPENPVSYTVTWTGLTAQTVTNIATQPVTYIGIDKDGIIIQSSSPFGNSEKRDYIDLGVLVHTNNVNITVVNNQPVISKEPGSQLYDLINSIGFFNVSGIEFTANGANLSIDRSEGEIFKQGSNVDNDYSDPHKKTIPSAIAYSDIRYRLRTAGSEILPGTAFIDPDNYDNAGVQTAVPTGKVTVQRINIFSSGDVRLQYGQNLYDSIEDAVANAPSEEFVVEPNISQNGLFRAFLVVKEGATDLSNPLQAKFIQASYTGRASETYPGATYRTSIINSTSTGIRAGGVLSKNTSGLFVSPAGFVTLDISAGNGVIVDNYTDPNNPSITEVSWDAFTDITPTYLATAIGSYILIQSNGTLLELPVTSPPTAIQKRDNIFLGFVGHADNSNVINVFNFPIPNPSPANQLEELADAIGPFNISGNSISLPGPGLTLNKGAGSSYFFGGNFQINSKVPSTLNVALLTGPTLIYAKQDVVLGPTSANVDTSQYDNAGTLTSMPTNQFTNHRIWLDPINNQLIFQYGQNTYGNITEAQAAIPTEDYTSPTILSDVSYILGVLITQQGTTDLSDSLDATFIPQSKFGGSGGGSGGGGGGTTTLQDAYNNSGNPEILTDASRGALTLRRGSAADTDNIYEGQNGAGSVTFSLDGNGNVTTGTWQGSTIGEIYGGTGVNTWAAGEILYADGVNSLAALGAGSAGTYLRSGGIGVPVSWSTASLPNTATAGDLIVATSLNNYDNLSAVATGSVLLSQGVGTQPIYGAVVDGLTIDFTVGTTLTAEVSLSSLTEDYLAITGSPATGSAGELLSSDGAGGFVWTSVGAGVNPPDISTYSTATVTLTNISGTYEYHAGFDTTSNSIEVTLPAASAGKVIYHMKDIGCNSRTNIIRFLTAGSDTIITTTTGNTSFDLSNNGGAIILTSDGVNTWWLS